MFVIAVNFTRTVWEEIHSATQMHEQIFTNWIQIKSFLIAAGLALASLLFEADEYSISLTNDA